MPSRHGRARAVRRRDGGPRRTAGVRRARLPRRPPRPAGAQDRAARRGLGRPVRVGVGPDLAGEVGPRGRSATTARRRRSSAPNAGRGYRFVGAVECGRRRAARASGGRCPRRGCRSSGASTTSRPSARCCGEHRVVTVTGPGGAGKSTLAVRAGARRRRARSFVELAPVRHRADVVRAVAEATGVEGVGADDAEVLAARLSGRSAAARPGQLRAPARRERRARRPAARRRPGRPDPGDQPRAAGRRRRGGPRAGLARRGRRHAVRPAGRGRHRPRAPSPPAIRPSSSCANGWTACPWRSNSPPRSCVTSRSPT